MGGDFSEGKGTLTFERTKAPMRGFSHGDADKNRMGRSMGHYTDSSISNPQTSGKPNMTPTDRSEKRMMSKVSQNPGMIGDDDRLLSRGDYMDSRGARY